MIIPIKRDRNSIKVNSDFASAVPEFAELLNEESLGVKCLAYVVYSLDPSEENIWFNLPDEIRRAEVSSSLGLTVEQTKDARVVSAMKKYKQFCDSNVSYQFKDAHQKGMQKISDYVKNKKSVDDEDAKEFAAVLEKMPSLLKGKSDIEKMQSKDAKSGRVTAGRKLTLNEAG